MKKLSIMTRKDSTTYCINFSFLFNSVNFNCIVVYASKVCIYAIQNHVLNAKGGGDNFT